MKIKKLQYTKHLSCVLSLMSLRVKFLIIKHLLSHHIILKCDMHIAQ